jgi:hypothetical protein
MPAAPAKTTVRLPYVLVPNMDTSSRLFHKAQNTIAKQAKASAAKQVDTASPSPTASSTSSAFKTKMARLFNLEQGTSLPTSLKSDTPSLFVFSRAFQLNRLGRL